MKRLLWIVGSACSSRRGIAYYVRVDVSAAPTQLTFDAVSRGDVVATVEATGTLQPLDTVEVGTQVSGTIASLGTDFNQLVKRGQVLATLDPGALPTQIDQAKATVLRLQSDVERAQVQLEDAQLKLKRAEQLAEAQLLAQQDVDTARSTARVAETSLTGARAQLDAGGSGADAGEGQPVAHGHHVADRRHRAEPQRGGRSDGVGQHCRRRRCS